MDELPQLPVTSSRGSREAKRFAWTIAGGLVGLHSLIAVLVAFYVAELPNAHNLAGAFLLRGVYMMLLIGSVPAFLTGAVVGAVAARRSNRTAAVAVGSFALVVLSIGAVLLVIPSIQQRVAYKKAISAGSPATPAVLPTEFIRISQEGKELVLARSYPDSSRSAAVAPRDMPELPSYNVFWWDAYRTDQFRKLPGEGGDVFSGNDLDPPGATMRLSWPEPDRFEVVIDIGPGGTDITHIDAVDFADRVATLNGQGNVLPIDVPPSDLPQQVTIRATRFDW